MKRALVLGGLALMGLGLFVWLILGGGQEDEPAQAGESAFIEAPSVLEEVGLSSEDAPSPQGLLQEDAREPVGAIEQGALLGRLLAPDGAGVPGARVQWTAWSQELEDETLQLGRPRLESLVPRTVIVHSGADGRFAFEAPPLGIADSLSYVWISHPEFEARSFTLSEGAEGHSRDLEHVDLVPAAAKYLEVRSGGDLVVGARVVQRMDDPDHAYSLPDDGPPDPGLVFFEEFETGPDGRSALALFDNKVRIVASSGRLRSKELVTHLEPLQWIELGMTFGLEGTAFFPPIDPDWGAPVLRVSRRLGPVEERLLDVPLSGSGPFDRIDVPRLDSDEYVVTLSAGPHYAEPVAFTAPPAEGTVTVALDAGEGEGVWLLAQDSSGEPLPGEELEVSWISQGASGHALALTDARGYAYLEGLPPALPCVARGDSRGRFTERSAQFTLPLPRPEALVVVLGASRRIEGRVLRDGEPVPSFKVAYWQTGQQDTARSQTVVNHLDGRFVLEDAFTGALDVEVIGEDFGRSGVQHVSSEDQGRVVFELGTPLPVSGVVLDTVSQEPVEGAAVLLMANRDVAAALALGATPVRTDAEGRFELLGGVTGAEAVVRVEKPGYSVTQASLADVSGARVWLAPFGELDAKLLLPDDLSASAFSLAVRGGTASVERLFPDSGHLILQDVPAGQVSIELSYGDGSDLFTVEARSVDVLPLERSELAFDLSAHVSLDIVGRIDAMDLSTLAAEVMAMESSSGAVRQARFGADGTAHLRFMTPGEWELEGSTGDPFVRASRRAISVTSAAHQEVELDFVRARTQLEILDSQGAPLAHAQLFLRARGSLAAPLRTVTTDAEGRAELFVDPNAEPELFFVGSNQERAALPRAFVDELSEDGIRRLSYRVADFEPLEVQVEYAGKPLAKAAVMLGAASGELLLGDLALSDDEGLVSFPRVGRGRYSLHVVTPRVSARKQVIEVGPGGASARLDVRFLGSCQLVFAHRDGSPVVSAQVAITYTETGESLEELRQAGFEVPSGMALVTDEAGRLELDGLPLGEYQCKLGENGFSFDVSWESGAAVSFTVAD